MGSTFWRSGLPAPRTATWPMWSSTPPADQLRKWRPLPYRHCGDNARLKRADQSSKRGLDFLSAIGDIPICNRELANGGRAMDSRVVPRRGTVNKVAQRREAKIATLIDA